MMVRFATKCDTCGARSEEYTAWPTCRECDNDACPDCSEPGTMIEDDGRQTVICRSCSNIEGGGYENDKR